CRRSRRWLQPRALRQTFSAKRRRSARSKSARRPTSSCSPPIPRSRSAPSGRSRPSSGTDAWYGSDSDMNRRIAEIVAGAGCAIGAVFGVAGTMVSGAPLRQTFWAIDGVAIIVASALVTVTFLRRGDDVVAAGFLVFAIGESLLVSGTAAGLEGSVPSFGG